MGGLMGNLLNVLGGLKAHRASQDPRSKCLEEEQNEEVSGRGGDFKGPGNGPITGWRSKVGQGYMGHPQSLVSRGGVTATQEQKKWTPSRERKREESYKNEKMKKKAKKRSNGKNQKKKKILCSKALVGIDLETFPKGLRAHPLDQKYAFHRATRLINVPQSSYLPYTLKMVSAKVTLFSVVQIVLLYYPRSTLPGCVHIHHKRKSRGTISHTKWRRSPSNNSSTITSSRVSVTNPRGHTSSIAP